MTQSGESNMAKIKLNPLFAEMRGKMGNIVIKQSKNGQPFIAALPQKSKKAPSQAQLAHRQAFAMASEYASTALADEGTRAFYEDLARRRKTTVRPLCVGDYMNKPIITQLDVSEYKGRIGDPIFIRAHDDVGVVAVNVKLTKAEGTPIESGQAVQRSGDTWVYMATVAIPLGTHLFISADAFDRPGHRAVATVNPIVGESS
jgi:hypothetical protein